MLLQPLVENAIVHGFEPGGGTGAIGVTVRRDGGRLYCRVEDDGQGFDPASLPADGKGGIGLDSVRNRLEYYFRGQYLFAIHSRVGEGTAIELSFPAIGGDSHA